MVAKTPDVAARIRQEIGRVEVDRLLVVVPPEGDRRDVGRIHVTIVRERHDPIGTPSDFAASRLLATVAVSLFWVLIMPTIRAGSRPAAAHTCLPIETISVILWT